jgi:hypothetical protein
MSGIFRNLSNSGIARFRNVSNSGRGVFYGPGTPIEPGGTTTSTTTTTTTSGITTTTTTTTTSTTTTTTTAGVYYTIYLTINDAGSPCSALGTLYTKKALVDTITNGTVIYNINNTTWVPGAGATQIVQWTDGSFTIPLTNIFSFNGLAGTVGSDTGTPC